MTIVNPDVTRCEGAMDIVDKMDISLDKIFHTFDEQTANDLISEYNDLFPEMDETPIESANEMHTSYREQWADLIPQSAIEIALDVLRNRNEEYIHIVDETMIGHDFHMFIEL